MTDRELQLRQHRPTRPPARAEALTRIDVAEQART